MGRTTVWRPGVGDTERDRMRAAVAGELTPRVPRELRESAEDLELVVLGVPGGFVVADPSTGEVVKGATGIAGVEAFVREWPMRDHVVKHMHVGEILAYFPGATVDDAPDVEMLKLRAELRRRQPAALPTCAPGGSMALGTFRGGPLNGQRHLVPEHGPGWCRHHHDGVVEWYAHRVRTLRTYAHVGAS